MKLPINKQLGFTLIEQIISLSVFMMCLLLLMTCMQMIQQIERNLRVPDGLEWHLAMIQLHEASIGTHLSNDKQNRMFSHNPDMIAVAKSSGKRTFMDITLKLSDANRFYYAKNGGNSVLIAKYKHFTIKRHADCVLLNCEMPFKHQFEYPFRPGVHAIQLLPEKSIKTIYTLKSKGVDNQEQNQNQELTQSASGEEQDEEAALSDIAAPESDPAKNDSATNKQALAKEPTD